MKKLVFILVVVFVLFSSYTKAQMDFKPIDLSINTPQDDDVYKKYTEGKTYLGLTFGTSIPFGNYGSFINSGVGGNINPGFGASIYARYFISDHFAFGASFGFYRSGLSSSYLSNLDSTFTILGWGDTVNVLSVTGSSTLYPFVLNLEYFLTPLKRFKPYFGLGLGFYVINYSIDVETNTNKPQDFLNAEALLGSSTTENFGLSPYFGFMYDFNELVSLDFDIKYNQIFSSPASSALTINFGLIFNLSYKY